MPALLPSFLTALQFSISPGVKQKETCVHLVQAIRAESESMLILLLTLLQRVSLKADAGNVTKHVAATAQEARGRRICPEMLFRAEGKPGDQSYSSCLACRV